ncbi:Hypothetical predicted protein [Cloeon dipterum]|uniref:Uncharacterized protein n=1 Tax=Cloeon dipterum TaxID=197152 RepID=A0A8S1CTD6_9INSE|nr:Hypothetical predicted protein [Cloeon dipterum]
MGAPGRTRDPAHSRATCLRTEDCIETLDIRPVKQITHAGKAVTPPCPLIDQLAGLAIRVTSRTNASCRTLSLQLQPWPPRSRCSGCFSTSMRTKLNTFRP